PGTCSRPELLPCRWPLSNRPSPDRGGNSRLLVQYVVCYMHFKSRQDENLSRIIVFLKRLRAILSRDTTRCCTGVRSRSSFEQHGGLSIHEFDVRANITDKRAPWWNCTGRPHVDLIIRSRVTRAIAFMAPIPFKMKNSTSQIHETRKQSRLSDLPHPKLGYTHAHAQQPLHHTTFSVLAYMKYVVSWVETSRAFRLLVFC
ncbi:unnamed protein product, partial [Ectocarpus sp. 12 AP-2014]